MIAHCIITHGMIAHGANRPTVSCAAPGTGASTCTIPHGFVADDPLEAMQAREALAKGARPEGALDDRG